MTSTRLKVIDGDASAPGAPANPRETSRAPASLQLIPGQREEHECLYRRLLTEPHTFEQQEFEHLLEVVFKDRIGPAEQYDIACDRIRKGSYEDPLEHHTLLAIIHSDDQEFKRLLALLDRRKQLGLQVLRIPSPDQAG